MDLRVAHCFFVFAFGFDPESYHPCCFFVFAFGFDPESYPSSPLAVSLPYTPCGCRAIEEMCAHGLGLELGVELGFDLDLGLFLDLGLKLELDLDLKLDFDWELYFGS